MKNIVLISSLFVFFHASIKPILFSSQMIHSDSNHTLITTKVRLADKEVVYKNSMILSINHPHVFLETWNVDKKATEIYHPGRKEQIIALENEFTLTAHAIKKTDVPLQDVFLHFICI